MSSVRSWPSLGGDKEPARQVQIAGDIVKSGYLKKLKTMKKKFFVLRGDTLESSARLEYYDSEKKFKSNHAPKRCITLKTCFNINKRSDTRQKWVIALYTKNECFCLVMENEEELEDWLKVLLTLQHGEDVPDGEQPKPTFDHVWQVTVQKKELGHSRNILGPYLLCLTERTLSLVRMDPESDKPDTIEFSLHSIRRCGDLESFFYMEVGQMSVTGAGNLWMQTEDNNIAQNMHAAIMTACRNCKDFGPMLRNRSHSTNESSRPISVCRDSHPRWPTHSAAYNNGNNINNNSNTTNNNNAVAVGSCGSGITGGNAGGGVVVGMHQRTYSFPLSPIPPSRRASTGTRPNKKPSTSHSLSGVRERCDSLPSRARTTSEGASHIPQQPHRNVYLRPQSVYNRTVSYSPPVIDSSPVSPESRACSTDSAGSSLSMEGDGMGMGDGTWESGIDRYGHSLTPDEPVILEENDDTENVHWHPGDDYVAPDKNMCLTINNYHCHKNSPNPSSSGFKSSSPSQGSLADMCSPCGSSPLESSGAYMPMSPGDKPNVTGCNFPGGLRATVTGGSVSVNHSRGSSLAEEGYVHMAPMIHDDGYVDMYPNSGNARNRRNIPDHYRSGELSPASSGSITSGTPSTDIRFSEYPLDKVSTYITPSEEEIIPSERPARAYSVGSRPTFNKRNDIVNQSDCQQRVRAFSVGSRCPRVHSAHLTPPPRHPLSSSHSSVEPNDDLMELDFTKNSKSRNRSYSKKPSSSERLSVPHSSNSVASSAASSYSTAEGSYMEMSPRSSPKPLLLDNEIDSSHLCPSPPKNNRLSNLIGRSPPKSFMEQKPSFSSSSPPVSGLSSIPLYKVPEGDSSYVEMTSGNKGELLPQSSPPISIISRDGRSSSITEDSYMEMNPAVETKSVIAKSSAPRVDSFPVTEKFKQQNFSKTTFSPPIKPALISISTSDILKSKSGQEDLDMNVKRKHSLIEDNNNKIMIGRTNPIDTPKKAPDGYVEMTLGNSRPVRKSSLDNYKMGELDYMNMSGGSAGKRERRGSRKERNRYSSQPIAIQSTVSKDQSSSTSPVFTFVGRKHSTGTPPKVPSYLPLGNFSTSPSSSPYSSLGRRTRKTPRRESKELSSSGSSTPIFPLSLNSPSSPMKPFGQVNNREKDAYESASKCPVDATSGTVRISYSPTDHSTASQPNLQHPPVDIEENDYVNFNPLNIDLKESLNNDYAPMKPVNPSEPSRKISAPSILHSAKSRSVDRIITAMSNLTVSSPEIHSVPNNDSSNSNSSSNICTVSVTSANELSKASVSSVNNIKKACESVTNSNNSNNLKLSSSGAVTANSSVPNVAPTVPPITASDVNAVPVASLTDVTSSTTTANLIVTTTVSSVPCLTLTSTVTTTSATSITTDAAITNVSNNTASAVANTIDKELHYASLDLARSNSIDEASGFVNNGPNRSIRNQSSTSSASTPSPNINQNLSSAFSYAEIDFSKSSSSNNSNSTVH